MASTEKEKVEKSSIKRSLEGEVISNKMQKTIVVKVSRRYKHPVLGKTVTKSKKYKVHDENEIANVGDLVSIVECRPFSKTKHMTLNSILRKAS